MGLPFLPVRGIIGSGYMQVREDFKVLENPYNREEKVALVPAITPSAGIFHAFQADWQGNIMADPLQESKLMAQATSGAVIATVEEMVEDLTPDNSRTFIPQQLITAVVCAPGGAHPASCKGFYEVDGSHIKEYLAAAREPEKWRRYMEYYVYGPRDHDQYLKLVGRA